MFERVFGFCDFYTTAQKEDVMIVLGDAGTLDIFIVINGMEGHE